jgi:hypothetical protein
MSRMSDLALMAENLVIDAMSQPGVMSDHDVLEYVNERMPIEVGMWFVESVLDKMFGNDWDGEFVSYN